MGHTGSKMTVELEQLNALGEGVSPLGTQREDSQTAGIVTARLLWANRRLLRTALLLGLIVGAVLSLLTPPLYVSNVQLMPPDSRSTSGTAMLAALLARGQGSLGSLIGEGLGAQSSGALFIGVLRSRTLEDRLVNRFNLTTIYRDKLEEDARKDLADRTGLFEDKKSGIISISVTDHDRARARSIAAAYVEELNRLVAELSTSSARREREFLETRLATVKVDLDQASQELSLFSSKNGAIDIKEQGRAMLEAGATLQGEVIAAEAQLRGLETIYTPNNVRVRSLQARIAELNKQLHQVSGTGNTDNMENASAASLYPPLRKLPLLGVKYADLYRKVKIEEAIFETLTQQYELAKVEEAKEIPSVRMLDEADLPQRKSFPPRTVMTLTIGLIAVLLAAFWVLGKNRWEQAGTDNAKKQFAQEILRSANLPWATPNGSRR